MLSVIMLGVASFFVMLACHYAEYRGAQKSYLNVVLGDLNLGGINVVDQNSESFLVPML
jgi:hypothetical protein